MSRATNDLSAVRMMVGPAVMYTREHRPDVRRGAGDDGHDQPAADAVALLPLPIVTLVARYFGRAIHERFERIQAAACPIMSAVTQEALAGVRVVRAYRQEQHELERFRARQPGVRRAQPRADPAAGPVLSEHGPVHGALGAARAVAWQPRRHRRPDDRWRARRVQRLPGDAGVADDRVRLGHEPSAARPRVVGPDAGGDGHAAGDRRHRRTRHPDLPVGGHRRAHRAARPVASPTAIDRVLDDINVTIAAGQTVAIVGRTGSGKSTLLSLLARLHDPPPGTVFVDGIDVREMPLATLRGAIGFVPQEPFLFSDTIAENVAFGRAGLEPVRHVASAASGAAQLVSDGTAVATIARPRQGCRATFPPATRRAIGERGITLSGGQKQRTAIARALYIDPRILILDDALSAVDTQTEEDILARLRDVMRQRTSLIVSHRISTVRDADLILVLDDGRIVEHGTHDAARRARRAVCRAASAAAARGGAGGLMTGDGRRSGVGDRARRSAGGWQPRSVGPANTSTDAAVAASRRPSTRHDPTGDWTDARRRRSRKSVRRAADAAAAACICGRTGERCSSRWSSILAGAALQLVPPWLTRQVDRRLHPGARCRRRCADRRRSTSASLVAEFALAVRADLDAADDGAAHHVRPADADLRASAAARRRLLRSQSGRPADDARHDRR